MSDILIQLLLLFNLAICVISEVYYIKPTIEYQYSSQDQPCLTLDDFIVNISRSLNANTSLDLSLKLLPGNHTLSRHLQIWSIRKFQISPQINSSWIICQAPIKDFQFLYVTTIEIRNLNFLGFGGCNLFHIGKFTAESCVFLRSEFSQALFGVILAMNSTVEIQHCSFIGTNYGSIIHLSHSEISSSHSVYNNNTASVLILDKETTAVFDSCVFQNNTAVQFALVISNASTIVIEDCLWECNNFQTPWPDRVHDTDPNRKFEFIILCIGSVVTVREIIIANNMQTNATMGGVLMATYSNISIHNCTIEHNFGQNYILYISFSNTSITNTTMLQNTAEKGEFLIISEGNITEFQELSVRENRGNFRLLRSKIKFSDRIMYFNNNGSIIALNSLLNFYGNNLFLKCRHILPIKDGGIVASDKSTLHFYGTTYFILNYSPNKGGAIFAANSKLYIHHKVIIAYNVAKISGGGIYLYYSEFYCLFNCTFFQNAAVKGGGIHAVSSKLLQM